MPYARLTVSPHCYSTPSPPSHSPTGTARGTLPFGPFRKLILSGIFLVLVATSSLALEAFPQLKVTAKLGGFLRQEFYPSESRLLSEIDLDTDMLRQGNVALFANFGFANYFIESKRGILQWCPWFCDYTSQLGIRYEAREDLSFKLYWKHQCSHQIEQASAQPIDNIVPEYDIIMGEITWALKQ